MPKRILLLSFCLVASLTILNCNNKKVSDESDDTTTQPSTPASTSTGSNPIPTPALIPTPTSVTMANENIDDTDTWLTNLGINWGDDNALIVNAANKELAGEGGIDGDLSSWASVKGIKTPWKDNPEVIKRDETNTYHHVTSVDPGNFAVLRVYKLGGILLAVGPKASEVTTLADTAKMVEDLYYDILSFANNNSALIKKVVLCAVSTGLFAGAGTESATGKAFTKEQFLRYIWNGIHTGINGFKADNPGSALEIILNNWNPS